MCSDVELYLLRGIVGTIQADTLQIMQDNKSFTDEFINDVEVVRNDIIHCFFCFRLYLSRKHSP